jgi:glycosyltransferase involved in cell wall biosynthesis
MSDQKILLTIAIPTFSRAEYLRINLAQLEAETAGKNYPLEILVADNCSPDDTQAVVADFIARGMQIRYIRNSENIGSDHNIAQCFNDAAGQYVVIFGDDDLFVDGALDKLLKLLGEGRYGVVSLRAYGFDRDFRAERPSCRPSDREFSSPGAFIAKIGANATFISGNVINKKMLPGVDARKYCGTALVQMYLVYSAAMNAGRNIILNNYLVACKRNNSGNFIYSQVFAERFWAIVDTFKERGLDQDSMDKLARNMLFGYYPFYIFKMRLASRDRYQEDYLRFHARFKGNAWFWITISPIFTLPRPLAIIWGAIIVVLGRSLTGDACRGISFARTFVLRKLGLGSK